MPTPIAFTITAAGVAAAIAADGMGIDLQLTHVALGAGNGGTTAMIDRREKATISAGGTPAPNQLAITASFITYGGAEYDMREIGLWAGDPDSGGVLFAYASVAPPARLAVRNGSIAYTASFTVALSGVPTGSVAVTVDSEGGVAAAMLANHLAAANPHPQYVPPAGIVELHYGATLPSGRVACAGQVLNRATYPELWAYAQAQGATVADASWSATPTAFSTGDGTTTFRMPDLRGEFFRGWDNGRGIDAGRAIRTQQAQQVQQHKHATSSGSNTAGPFGATATGGRPGITQDNDNVWDRTNDGTDYDGTVNAAGVIGAETRPRNVALQVAMTTGRL